jgi:sarcosine oxidase
VGGQLPDRDTDWRLGRDEVSERTRRVLTGYVEDYVTDCEPRVVDTIYCNVTSGLGDGVGSARCGPVLAVWGDNLFKLAPMLGRVVSAAAVDGTLPQTLQDVAPSPVSS